MKIKMKYLTRGSYIAAAIIVLLVFLGGCEGFRIGNSFLEKPATKGVNKDSISSNPVYARELLVHAYESLYFGLGNDGPYYNHVMGDNDPIAGLTDINQSYNDNNGGGPTMYYNGSLTPSMAAQYPWRTPVRPNSRVWPGIRDAYLFLGIIDKVPDMDKETKNRLKGEAWTIIGFDYTKMFRNYGGMYWVDHAYGPNEDFNLPRMTAKATLDSIVAVLDRAISISDLPFSYPRKSTQLGHFTQAGAMGLKCRVLLYGASPLFNNNQPYLAGKAASEHLTWYGKYDSNLWKRAKKACGDLIDKVEQTEDYHLADTGHPRQDFRHAYFDRDSPEVLISTRKGYKGSGGANGLPNSIVNEGVGNTTDNYVKMFPMADGTPIGKSGSGYDPSHPYQNRDPRLYETVLVNGVPYKGRTSELWVGGREHKTRNERNTRTGYREFKFALDFVSSRDEPIQWPTMRLPEIYLAYAEAINEVEGHPTAEACKYVNKIRNRVDLDDLPGCTNMTKKEFLDAVLRERVLELGYENHRWYDMTRRKLKDVYTKTLYGMRICKKGTPAVATGACKARGYGRHESSGYIYTRFKIPTRYWAKSFSPKWYLTPFAQDEVNKGYGIIQNPGW